MMDDSKELLRKAAKANGDGLLNPPPLPGVFYQINPRPSDLARAADNYARAYARQAILELPPAITDMTREIVTKAMADKDARIATLEAALRPFVRPQVLETWAGHQGVVVVNLSATLRDLRRAATALGDA